MVGYEENRDELKRLDIEVVAASVDAIDKAREVSSEVSFPIAYGVTRDMADSIGAWWEDARSIIEPSEFLLDRAGKIMTSSYCSGPLGRTLAPDVISLVELINKYR